MRSTLLLHSPMQVCHLHVPASSVRKLSCAHSICSKSAVSGVGSTSCKQQASRTREQLVSYTACRANMGQRVEPAAVCTEGAEGATTSQLTVCIPGHRQCARSHKSGLPQWQVLAHTPNHSCNSRAGACTASAQLFHSSCCHTPATHQHASSQGACFSPWRTGW